MHSFRSWLLLCNACCCCCCCCCCGRFDACAGRLLSVHLGLLCPEDSRRLPTLVHSLATSCANSDTNLSKLRVRLDGKHCCFVWRLGCAPHTLSVLHPILHQIAEIISDSDNIHIGLYQLAEGVLGPKQVERICFGMPSGNGHVTTWAMANSGWGKDLLRFEVAPPGQEEGAEEEEEEVAEVSKDSLTAKGAEVGTATTAGPVSQPQLVHSDGVGLTEAELTALSRRELQQLAST